MIRIRNGNIFRYVTIFFILCIILFSFVIDSFCAPSYGTGDSTLNSRTGYSQTAITNMAKAVLYQSQYSDPLVHLLGGYLAAEKKPAFIVKRYYTDTVQYHVVFVTDTAQITNTTFPVNQTVTVNFSEAVDLYIIDFAYTKNGGTNLYNSFQQSVTSFTVSYPVQELMYVYGSFLQSGQDWQNGSPSAYGTLPDPPAVTQWLDLNDAYNGRSYDKGFTEGIETGYNDGYGAGFTDGIETGRFEGYQGGYRQGYSVGYETGYSSGYSDGLEVNTVETVVNEVVDIPGVVSSVPSAIRTFIDTAFDIEIFNINIAGLLSSFMILAIVIVVIGFMVGRRR